RVPQRTVEPRWWLLMSLSPLAAPHPSLIIIGMGPCGNNRQIGFQRQPRMEISTRPMKIGTLPDQLPFGLITEFIKFSPDLRNRPETTPPLLHQRSRLTVIQPYRISFSRRIWLRSEV